MTARTPAVLRANMAVGVSESITAADIHDVVDTLEARTPVCVTEFGAKLDGATDDTAAWNQALATGRVVYFPEGTSLITDGLTLAAGWGAGIVGAGREKSNFLVNHATFNMAAPGVVRLGGAFQILRGFGFKFVQPTTTLRSAVKQYPAAVNMAANGRALIAELRIDAGWTGIDATGNAGGSTFDDLHVGCFSTGLLMDGSLDSMRVSRYHFWPFGIAQDTALYNIYSDGNTYACQFGRVDDLKIESMISFRGRIRFFAGAGGIGAFGSGSNIALDGDYSRIEFEQGEMALAAVHGSSGLVTGDYLIRQTGGELVITGLTIEAGVLTEPLVRVEHATAVFVASGIRTIALAGGSAFSMTAGVMHLSNGYLMDASTGNRLQPMVNVQGGRATLMGLRCQDSGGGTRIFIRVATDDHHVVMGNTKTGWTYSFPGTQTLGIYGPNN